jgi:hypothetical protein
VIYERDSDLVIAVVGEAFSGKHYTIFGSGNTIGLDMRGALERVTDELLDTAK